MITAEPNALLLAALDCARWLTANLLLDDPSRAVLLLDDDSLPGAAEVWGMPVIRMSRSRRPRVALPLSLEVFTGPALTAAVAATVARLAALGCPLATSERRERITVVINPWRRWLQAPSTIDGPNRWPMRVQVAQFEQCHTGMPSALVALELPRRAHRDLFRGSRV